MKPIAWRFVLPLTLILATSWIFAQNPAGPQGVKNACAADIQKFCAGIEHGQGKVFQCLEENRDSLEAGCRAQLDRTRSRMRRGMKVCRQDIQKHCADVKRGQGRIYQCLKANEDSLTEACKAHIQDIR